jgi:DUF1016 N-terminal domain
MHYHDDSAHHYQWIQLLLELIAASTQQAIQAVNTSLIDLHWQVGIIINSKIASTEWGDCIVNLLANEIAQT